VYANDAAIRLSLGEFPGVKEGEKVGAERGANSTTIMGNGLFGTHIDIDAEAGQKTPFFS